MRGLHFHQPQYLHLSAPLSCGPQHRSLVSSFCLCRAAIATQRNVINYCLVLTIVRGQVLVDEIPTKYYRSCKTWELQSPLHFK